MNTLDETQYLAPGYEDVFECLPYPALIMHRQGSIRAANEAFQRQTPELAEQSWTGTKSITDVFDGELQDLCLAVLSAATGDGLSLALKATAKSAPERIRFMVRPMRKGRERPEFFLICRDASKPVGVGFKALNIQVRTANELSARVRRQNHILQQGYDALEHFSHAAAHDLKAPLRSIEHCLVFLNDGQGAVLSENAKGLIADALNSAIRLQHLISDLLKHAQSARAPLVRSQLDLHAVVRNVEKSLAAMFAETKATLVVDGPLGQVSADRTLLHQLLENLISNALKYRHPDRPPKVTVARDSGNGKLIIKDNGQGFEARYKDRLFAPFERLHAHSDIEGSGIGLSTCQKICEHHGWRIDAKGSPGQGATFTVHGIGDPGASVNAHADARMPASAPVGLHG